MASSSSYFHSDNSKIFPEKYLNVLSNISIWVSYRLKLNARTELIIFPLSMFFLPFPLIVQDTTICSVCQTGILGTILNLFNAFPLLDIQPPNLTSNKREPEPVHLYPLHCLFPSTGHNHLFLIDHFNNL